MHKYIDDCQCIVYNSWMATRTRPPECCVPRAVKPVSAAKLANAQAVAKALSDKNRLEIMSLLVSQEGPVCTCDINEHVDLSQPTVSHHLKVLKEAGLVSAGKCGLWVFYEPSDAGKQALGALIGA